MNCCGNHSQGSQISSQENNQEQANKKGLWLKWILVVFIITLLVFSFIK